MQFTGKNLATVYRALELALGELHNQIATCPDVVLYASDIEELEKEQDVIERLMVRIDRSIIRDINREAA